MSERIWPPSTSTSTNKTWAVKSLCLSVCPSVSLPLYISADQRQERLWSWNENHDMVILENCFCLQISYNSGGVFSESNKSIRSHVIMIISRRVMRYRFIFLSHSNWRRSWLWRENRSLSWRVRRLSWRTRCSSRSSRRGRSPCRRESTLSISPYRYGRLHSTRHYVNLLPRVHIFLFPRNSMCRWLQASQFPVILSSLTAL